MVRRLTLILTTVILSHAAAGENYKQLLQEGATREKVQILYAEYATKVLGQSGDCSRELEALAGAADYKESFILACLSNGWIVRAVDIDHEYAPPSGAWAFSTTNFGGLVMQLPGDCKTIDCLDVPDFSGFKVKSLIVGPYVRGQLFSDSEFQGNRAVIAGRQPELPIRARSLKLRTPPRIDCVTLSKYSSDGKNASFVLHLSGANLDEGAVITINDEDCVESTIELRVDNSSWLGLGKDDAGAGYNLDPTYYAFPIYHYDSISTSVKNETIGRQMRIRVRNPDGQQSNELEYDIPSPQTLDSDGDGLLDAWETGEVDGLNLASIGANPHRKDVYVEVDRMIVPGRVWSDYSENAYPRREVFDDIKKIFQQAPVINPDLSVGVSLHIDYGQKDFEGTGESRGGTQIPWRRYIGFKDVKDTKVDVAQADQYCNATLLRNDPQYFDPKRKKVFRYCIFADQQWNSRSTGGGNKSTIFFLTLGVCRMNAVDRNYQIGVFVHELGHLFGLTHSGDQNGWYNNKPNFNSLMNYLFTFSGHDIDGKIGGVEDEVSGDQVYAYSEGMRAPIDEANLSEVLGVANHYPHDWNGNRVIESQPVQVMLRNPTYEIPRVLTDCCEWSRLKFTIGDE